MKREDVVMIFVLMEPWEFSITELVSIIVLTAGLQIIFCMILRVLTCI